MKKVFQYMCKCFVSALIAFVVLSIISSIYFNPPIAAEQTKGITNYKYIPDRNWSYMWEGHGHGRTDNMGYNNAYYDDSSNYDIVFVGSSHMEALQVPEDSNCVYLLNEMFDKDGKNNNNYKCLNLGVSGHFFETTASNYQYIAHEFKDAKYMIIEVFEVKYSEDVLDKIIDDGFRMPLEKKSFVYESLQKVSFLRLMYKKINETILSDNSSVNVESEANTLDNEESNLNTYIEKMNIILDEIAKASAENNIVPIILMHERFYEKSNGDIVMELDETYKKAFKECCDTNGIKIIDVSSDMVREYKDKFKFSYGFSNTAPGEGHLNKTGHRIIAEKMYNYINETEEMR